MPKGPLWRPAVCGPAGVASSAARRCMGPAARQSLGGSSIDARSVVSEVVRLLFAPTPDLAVVMPMTRSDIGLAGCPRRHNHLRRHRLTLPPLGPHGALAFAPSRGRRRARRASWSLVGLSLSWWRCGRPWRTWGVGSAHGWREIESATYTGGRGAARRRHDVVLDHHTRIADVLVGEQPACGRKLDYRGRIVWFICQRMELVLGHSL